MKPPKHNPKNETRPELWLSMAGDWKGCGRLRILYPNGRCEWFTECPPVSWIKFEWQWSCFNRFEYETLGEIRVAMKRYDRKIRKHSCGTWEPAIFVCYL